MAEETKKFPVMMIAVVVVICAILAGGIAYFIANKAVTDKGEKKAREPGIFVKLGDAKDGLIVNIGGVNSGRYLKIGLMIELKPLKKEAPPAGKGPTPDEIKILDAAVHVLRTQKIESFDPNRQDALKELLKNKINEALGEDRVYEVYITNFILQ